MKKYLWLLLLCCSSVHAELHYGQFSNLQSSAITGDIGGFKLILKKTKGKITGTIDIAAGDFTGEKALQKLQCDEAKGQCQFSFKNFDQTSHGQLDSIGKGYIFTYQDMEKHSQQVFLSSMNAKPYQGMDKDVTEFAQGQFYADVKKTQVISTLPEDSRITFEETVEDGNNFLIKITHGKNKGYIDVESFYQSYLAIIIQDTEFKTSLTSETKLLLKRGTLLGLIKPINAEWVKVSYRGEIGFIPRKAIVSEKEMSILDTRNN